MTLLTAAVVGGLTVGVVLLWPSRSAATTAGRASELLAGASAVTGDGADVGLSGRERLARAWSDDPVEMLRRWRARRRPADLEAAALGLLDAAAPALQAGLTPVAAMRLAVRSAPGEPSAEVRRFVEAVEEAGRSGQHSSGAWVELATRSGSTPLAFVAGAWRLSEQTGAPLAVAVERAAEGLRDARTRRRRVAVAVAGPRATVFVLTALPLTGPLFGLACGLSPGELYLGSPLSTASVVVGLLLVAVGRLWCRRLVRAAVGA